MYNPDSDAGRLDLILIRPTVTAKSILFKLPNPGYYVFNIIVGNTNRNNDSGVITDGGVVTEGMVNVLPVKVIKN